MKKSGTPDSQAHDSTCRGGSNAQAATVPKFLFKCNPCPAAKFLIAYQRDSTVELDQNPNFFSFFTTPSGSPRGLLFLFPSIFASSLFTAVLCHPPFLYPCQPRGVPDGILFFFFSLLFSLSCSVPSFPLFSFLIPLLFTFP